jgi:cytochrome c-type biogenesis protein CcmH/NrfG
MPSAKNAAKSRTYAAPNTCLVFCLVVCLVPFRQFCRWHATCTRQQTQQKRPLARFDKIVERLDKSVELLGTLLATVTLGLVWA